MKKTLVTGLVATHIDAERAIERILDCGFREEDISLVTNDCTDAGYVAFEDGTEAAIGDEMEGAAGAMLAAIAPTGTSVVVPRIGVVASGPIATAFSGAGTSASTGGIIGVLVDAGIPEYRARAYEAGVRRGEMLIGVHTPSESDAEIVEIMLEECGTDDSRGGQPSPGELEARGIARDAAWARSLCAELN